MRKSNTSACQVCLLQTLEMATKEQRKQTRNDEGLDIGSAQQLSWEQMVFQMGADCLSDGSRSPFRWEQIAFKMKVSCLLHREQITCQTTADCLSGVPKSTAATIQGALV